MKKTILLLCICCLSVLAYAGGEQELSSEGTGISFTLPAKWKVADLKEELFEEDEDPDFAMPKPKGYRDFDIYECLSPEEDISERGFVVYLFKNGALNATQLTYNGLGFQQEGMGGMVSCGKNKFTRTIFDQVPAAYDGMQVEQFTLTLKKINVLIYYWKDADGLPVDEVDEEMERILCSFHLN